MLSLGLHTTLSSIVKNTFRWKLASEPSTDPAYILQLPMAKAGVRALDTVENFLTSATAPDEVIAQMQQRYVNQF